jgi:hypothetical protein
MKRSLLVNIALALVVASIAAWMILRPGEESTATRSISQKKAADATRIAIERNGLPGFVLEKDKAGNWIQSAPFPARTDSSKAPRLLDVLGARAKTTFPATDLGRFDLDQPFARMTIDDQVFAFGTVNAITNEQYVLAGDTVFLVSPVHGFALPTQVDSLASHLLLAEDEIPTAFSLPGVTIELRDGKWLRTPPASDPEKHSQDDFVRWTEQWRYASSLATRVPTGKPVGESVRITLQNGRTIEMRILSRSPELRLLRTDENLEYVFAAETGARLLSPGPAAN